MVIIFILGICYAVVLLQFQPRIKIKPVEFDAITTTHIYEELI